MKGLIVRQGKYLLCQVRETVAVEEVRGKWELPGGHLEENETPEGALTREIEEELGVKCRLGRLKYSETIEHPGGKEKLLVYLVEEIIGNIVLSEHDRIEWVHPSDFDKYDIWTYYRKCLQILTRQSLVEPF